MYAVHVFDDGTGLTYKPTPAPVEVPTAMPDANSSNDQPVFDANNNNQGEVDINGQQQSNQSTAVSIMMWNKFVGLVSSLALAFAVVA